MDRSWLFYVLLGAGVVAVPAFTDRLLKGRVSETARFFLGIAAAALTGLILALVARPLGL